MMFKDGLTRVFQSPFTIAGVLIAAAAFVTYTTSKAQNMSSEKNVDLLVGESGAAFAHRVPSLTHIDRQPAGLDFYTIRWPISSLGTAVIKHGALSTAIDNVISVTSVENSDYPEEGLSDIAINSTITSSEKISHDDAKTKTIAFLREIVRAGWRTTIPRSTPRLRGKNMSDYLLAGGQSTTLDPDYMPTLDEWMSYEDLTEWEFYYDHAFLTVQISRLHTLTDPKKPGVYLLSTHLKSEPRYYRDFVEAKDRARWREFLMPEIIEMAAHRAQEEIAYRKKGIAIDESYSDPPLPTYVK